MIEPTVGGGGVRGLFASRRARLAAILVVATAAVSVLVVAAAGSSLSYYVTPEEYQQKASGDGTRWRVAGRVVGESIVEENGSPVAFAIRGYEGAVVNVAYRGGYPNLFGPNTLVIVEGFKHHDHDKLEVHNGANGKPSLAGDDPHIFAIASDVALPDAPVPVIDRDDIAAIADLLVAHCGLKPPSETA